MGFNTLGWLLSAQHRLSSHQTSAAALANCFHSDADFLRATRYSLSWQALEWFVKRLPHHYRLKINWILNLKKIQSPTFYLSCVVAHLGLSSQGVKECQKPTKPESKKPPREFDLKHSDQLVFPVSQINLYAFDQNRINREEARCYCTAGFNSSWTRSHIYSIILNRTSCITLGLLIHGVINHSGPALSLFISFPIYQTQRFNSFATWLLLIQVSRDNCFPTSKPSSTKSKFVWEIYGF